MKTRIVKVLIVSMILMILTVVPAFAQEVTDPTKVITEDTFNANEQVLINDFHSAEVWRCENYVKYLGDAIYNLEETVRIKQEVVNNYRWLAQYNPYYNTLIPQAERDLAQAKAWVSAYKEYRKAVQADLKVRYKY